MNQNQRFYGVLNNLFCFNSYKIALLYCFLFSLYFSLSPLLIPRCLCSSLYSSCLCHPFSVSSIHLFFVRLFVLFLLLLLCKWSTLFFIFFCFIFPPRIAVPTFTVGPLAASILIIMILAKRHLLSTRVSTR